MCENLGDMLCSLCGEHRYSDIQASKLWLKGNTVILSFLMSSRSTLQTCFKRTWSKSQANFLLKWFFCSSSTNEGFYMLFSLSLIKLCSLLSHKQVRLSSAKHFNGPFYIFVLAKVDSLSSKNVVKLFSFCWPSPYYSLWFQCLTDRTGSVFFCCLNTSSSMFPMFCMLRWISTQHGCKKWLV